jgi:hypothetical protein
MTWMRKSQFTEGYRARPVRIERSYFLDGKTYAKILVPS